MIAEQKSECRRFAEQVMRLLRAKLGDGFADAVTVSVTEATQVHAKHSFDTYDSIIWLTDSTALAPVFQCSSLKCFEDVEALIKKRLPEIRRKLEGRVAETFYWGVEPVVK